MVFKFKRSVKLILKKEKRLLRFGRVGKAPEQFKAIVKNPDIDIFGDLSDKRRPFFFKRLFKAFSGKIRELRNKRKRSVKKNRRPPAPTAMLAGALCSSLLFISAAALLSLLMLFGGYGGSYREVKIPSLVAMSEEEARAQGNGVFEYEVEYLSNPDADEGTVISQSPSPNVIRRVYSSDRKIKIKITVNSPEEKIKLPKTVGLSLRDATLLLKNAGLSYRVVSEYSSVAPAGTVTYCSHPSGTEVDKEELIILRASLGKEIVYQSAPQLLGLGESEAIDKLAASGLKAGKITYTASQKPMGTVIAQDISAGTRVPEKTEISLTVSGGLRYSDD